MSHLRRAAKVDANQGEIVNGLRALGVDVYVVGKPVDLLCGFRGANYLLEVKDGGKPASARKKTKAQREFFDDWRGQVACVHNLDEAAKAVGLELKDWA